MGGIAREHRLERLPRLERAIEVDQAARPGHGGGHLSRPRGEARVEHLERLLALTAAHQLFGEPEEEPRARLLADAAAQLVELSVRQGHAAPRHPARTCHGATRRRERDPPGRRQRLRGALDGDRARANEQRAVGLGHLDADLEGRGRGRVHVTRPDADGVGRLAGVVGGDQAAARVEGAERGS